MALAKMKRRNLIVCFGEIFASRKIGENKWGTSKLEENAKLMGEMQKGFDGKINMVEVVDLEALVITHIVEWEKGERDDANNTKLGNNSQIGAW